MERFVPQRLTVKGFRLGKKKTKKTSAYSVLSAWARYEFYKNLRKFYKKHHAYIICVRFMEIFVIIRLQAIENFKKTYYRTNLGQNAE